jgi:hypothetical protein
MAISAARRQRLERACEVIHDRAFNPRKYELPPSRPSLPPTPAEPTHSRKEWLEERFRLGVQKEFARLGLK